MGNKIEWHETELNVKKELVSSDNRWHISMTQTGTEEPSFFLSNYDLLLTPHGTGKDYRQCFENFVRDCDEFIKKVESVRREAKQNLQSLIGVTNELGDSNHACINP